MPIIYTYPSVTPESDDLLLISDVSSTNPLKATRKCTVGDIVGLVTALVPGGGTVTDVKLDFNPVAGTDTGLRLWDGAAWQDDHTITTSGTFDVGGILRVGSGGTGLSTYADGDILYYDGTTSTTELQTVPIGAASTVLTVDPVTGFPVWLSVPTDTNTTYTFDVPAATTDLTLTGSDLSTNAVTITGGTDITVTRVTATELKIDSTSGGTVTSVGATNAMGVSSGITFVTNPAPITGAGTVDLSFGGTIGDMWYANTTTSMKLLGIGTSTTNPTGSVSNQVLVVDSTGTPMPVWANKEIAIQDAGVNVELATKLIDFTGAGVTATSTGAGLVEVNIPGGGGGVVSNYGAFTPVLVTQGVDGTLALVLEPNINYLVQTGAWNIVDRQVYFDFYIEFDLINTALATGRGTLGVAALDGEGGLIGLDEIDSTLSTLNTVTHNNAGVNICDVEYQLDEADRGWVFMPQNGKLNKFWGMDPAPSSNKSVAWLAWNNSQGAAATNGYFTQYTPPAFSTWFWSGEAADGKYILSGSLNPILNID